MRIKRFFRHFDFDGNAVAKFIFWLFDFGKGKWYLTLDRTNWEFGKYKVNFLVLAIAYRGTAIPIMWMLLDKKGSSNYSERKELIDRFIACFGNAVIAGILADREFVSKEWFSYLVKQKISFFIRINWNYLISDSRGSLVNAWQLFSGLRRGEKRILQGKRKIFGLDLNIAGLRCEEGGYLIVATTESADNAIETYGNRWQIETLFGCLKRRGFNLEDTHLNHANRLAKLMAVLAIAFCWAHKTGEWKNEVKPIKIKSHGRKTTSFFRSGLNFLRGMLCTKKLLKKGIRALIRLLFSPPPMVQMVKVELSS